MVLRKFATMSKSRGIAPYFYIGPVMAILTILMIYPMCMIIKLALYNNYYVVSKPVWVGLKNFIDFSRNEIFWVSLKNTVIFTVFSVFFHMIVGIAFAVLLNQPLNKIALTFFRSILILPWIFTAAIVAINWQLLLDPLGIINFILGKLGMLTSPVEWFGDYFLAMPTLIFVSIWRGYPFVMISILAGLQGIPINTYEAAKIDGADAWQIFCYVTLPQLKPILLSVGLLDTIWTFRLFPLIWLTTGGGPGRATEVLSTYTYKLAFVRFEFSKASALGTIILIFVMVFTFFYLKHQKPV